MSLTVFKLGGSLLDLSGLDQVLAGVVALRPKTAALLVVGGSSAADLVRGWDRLHRLGEERSHALALAAMRFNAELLLRIIPASRWIEARRDLFRLPAGHIGVLAADRFLEGCEATGNRPLPHHWDVTSDSIAAWAAHCWAAGELVLLKSVDLPAGCSPEDAANAGLVDRRFPQAAAGIPRVGWVNARCSPLAIVPWLDRTLLSD